MILVCRDLQRGEIARYDIQRASSNAAVYLLEADLASHTSIHRLAQAFQGQFQQLHVLVNNAGVIKVHRTETPDGLEMTFAVNHLVLFLLAHLLLPMLQNGAPSGIVNVSSKVHRWGQLTLTICRASSATTEVRHTISPSWPTCCSPTSWRAGLLHLV